jgi:hypothetical protein
MSFGKNPYVAKAEAAEQKAADASDEPSRLRALREAAHEWDRAAVREKPGKRRDEYARRAEENRALADAEPEARPAPSAPRRDAPPDRWN